MNIAAISINYDIKYVTKLSTWHYIVERDKSNLNMVCVYKIQPIYHTHKEIKSLFTLK